MPITVDDSLIHIAVAMIPVLAVVDNQSVLHLVVLLIFQQQMLEQIHLNNRSLES